MKKNIFMYSLVALLFITTWVGNTSHAAESIKSYDDDIYDVVRSYSNVEVNTFMNKAAYESNTEMIDSKSGDVVKTKIESIKTQKLYDLISKKDGQIATHFKTDIVLFSDHQTSESGTDDTAGLAFYETIYYTITQDKASFDYVNMNKIDYRFEVQDSSLKVGTQRMEILQNGIGIDGKTVNNQTKTVNLNNSGTILPRDYGWTSIYHALGSRVGTRTTATIQRGQSSSWEFSFSMNPR